MSDSDKKPMGRPSKYKPEFCDKIIEFFDRQPIESVEVTKEDKNGDPYTVTTERPCQCPTFEKFAADCGVARQTLHDWCKQHPLFLDAYNKARGFQANIMLVNGMSGAYNSGFTGLSMKNMHGWKDKSEVDNNHSVNMMPSVKIGGKEVEFDCGDEVESSG